MNNTHFVPLQNEKKDAMKIQLFNIHIELENKSNTPQVV
jgi:hypothetical protein